MIEKEEEGYARKKRGRDWYIERKMLGGCKLGTEKESMFM